MKPIIDKNKCIGCGTCAAICPEVFNIEGDGKAGVIPGDYANLQGKINQAKDSCPVQAISVE